MIIARRGLKRESVHTRESFRGALEESIRKKRAGKELAEHEPGGREHEKNKRENN